MSNIRLHIAQFALEIRYAIRVGLDSSIERSSEQVWRRDSFEWFRRVHHALLLQRCVVRVDEAAVSAHALWSLLLAWKLLKLMLL